MYTSGSKPGTSPAIVVGKPVGSKRVIRRMPLLPATTFCQVGCVPTPAGVQRPMPVTTTRSTKGSWSARPPEASPEDERSERDGQPPRYFFAWVSM
jgi:hypothetical protein